MRHQLRHHLPADPAADPSFLQHGAGQRAGVRPTPSQVDPLLTLGINVSDPYSSNPDPDPNTMYPDPQHWLTLSILIRIQNQIWNLFF